MLINIKSKFNLKFQETHVYSFRIDQEFIYFANFKYKLTLCHPKFIEVKERMRNLH